MERVDREEIQPTHTHIILKRALVDTVNKESPLKHKYGSFRPRSSGFCLNCKVERHIRVFKVWKK